MEHCNTVFNQILKYITRHEFETLANLHHTGRSFRKASRWSQFVSLAMAQLSGRNSLRDIIENTKAQTHLLQLNLFEKRDLMALLNGSPIRDHLHDPNQMSFV